MLNENEEHRFLPDSCSLKTGDIQNGVLVGQEGILFLNDGGHHVFDYATGRRRLGAGNTANFHSNLARRLAAAQASKAGFLQIIIPDKQSVMEQACPVTITCRLGSLYCSEPQRCLIYYRDFLSKLDEAPYLKTDTHLTHAASIRIAMDIATSITGASVDHEMEQLLRALAPEKLPVAGDLGSKLQPAWNEIRLRSKMSWKTLWLSNQFAGNNGLVDLRISASRSSAKRVLIFGDSFGRDIALFLSYVCEEVIFLRTPYFHDELVHAIQPDFIISQTAERYLDRVQPDELRPAFLLYPHLSGKTYQPGIEFAKAFSAILSFPRAEYVRFKQKVFATSV